MSTDVYLDTYKESPPPRGTEERRCWVAGECDVERIGYLFVVAQMEFDLLAWLRNFSVVYPVLTPTVAEIIVSMMRHLLRVNEEIAAQTPEYNAIYYHYHSSWTPPYEDVMNPDELAAYLAEHLGWYWEMRVD